MRRPSFLGVGGVHISVLLHGVFFLARIEGVPLFDIDAWAAGAWAARLGASSLKPLARFIMFRTPPRLKAPRLPDQGGASRRPSDFVPNTSPKLGPNAARPTPT